VDVFDDVLRVSADCGITTERTDVEVDTDVGVGIGFGLLLVPPIDIWRTFDADAVVLNADIGLVILIEDCGVDGTETGVGDAIEIDRIDDIDVVSSWLRPFP
jgi:ethanolamine utilization microcompartment shell protein EutL